MRARRPGEHPEDSARPSRTPPFRWRRGAKKAILAVAASMLTAVYHMLRTELYKDLGAGHFARRDRTKMIQRLVRRINDLGCPVQLTPLAA